VVRDFPDKNNILSFAKLTEPRSRDVLPVKCKTSTPLRGDCLKLIIGLGNPGLKYQTTRHNSGFLAVDEIAACRNIPVQLKGFDACYGKDRIGDIPILLVKPMTFMNISGTAVKKIVDYFKIDIQDMVVIHDDIDLPLGTIRLKAGGGHAGHKGLISIIDCLVNPEFVRVRIGIGRPFDKLTVERYVLEQFAEDEMRLLPEIMRKVSDAVTMIATSGIQAAMNLFNEKPASQLGNENDAVLP
jgi:peptidyl-tRNA hydrolase, PTH1 family